MINQMSQRSNFDNSRMFKTISDGENLYKIVGENLSSFSCLDNAGDDGNKGLHRKSMPEGVRQQTILPSTTPDYQYVVLSKNQ